MKKSHSDSLKKNTYFVLLVNEIFRVIFEQCVFYGEKGTRNSRKVTDENVRLWTDQGIELNWLN